MLKHENFEYLLDARLKKVYDKTWKEIPSRLNLLFTKRDSNKAVEYDYTLGDIGNPEKFDGQVKYQEIYGQYRTAYEHSEYVTGIRVQRKLLDDDQYAVIDKMPYAISRAMKIQREQDGAAVFNNAFSTGVTGSDGKALCASDHPAVGTTTEQTNVSTDAMSVASIKADRIRMNKFKTDKNQFAGVYPTILLCPIDLSDKAAEITKSDKVPYEISNTVNVLDGRYKVVDWLYLTDTNDYFMIDASMMRMFLIWYNRINTEFNRDTDSDTYVQKYSSYMRYSNGFSGWHWLLGHNVS